MAKKKSDEDEQSGQSGEMNAPPAVGSFESVKAELHQLESEIASAISVNEAGERSQVDQLLQTMQRRLREVNKVV